MAKGINYGLLMHKAWRQFMADVLSIVARDGLTGEHHFYISFDTKHAGVDMTAALRQRFPADMTIVLQDWFEDLAVSSDRFAVTLNFGNVPERLVIPFEAVKAFIDPSADLGLQFKEKVDGTVDLDGTGDPDDDDGNDGGGTTARRPKPDRAAAVVSLDKFRKT